MSSTGEFDLVVAALQLVGACAGAALGVTVVDRLRLLVARRRHSES
jgi:hypothetical protein